MAIRLRYGSARVVAVHSYDEVTNEVSVTIEDHLGAQQRCVLCIAALAADGGYAEIIEAAERRKANGQEISRGAANHGDRDC